MQNVSRFEANLLRLLSFFLEREPPEQALPLVEQRLEAPACLNPGAVRLAQDFLARGCTRLLARRGGWRHERHLRGEKVVSGRLWERTSPEALGLTFSGHALEFLVWITAARPDDRDPNWGPDDQALALGDRVLLFFAHEGLRQSASSLGYPRFRARPPLAVHGLCRLAYPEDFADLPPEPRPGFGPWIEGDGAAVLEALQTQLTERWVRLEASKERMDDPEQMHGLGRSQAQVLSAFLDAVEQAGRMDLARFLLRAATRWLPPGVDSGLWVGGLRTAGLRLADRAAVYQAATAPLRALERLQTWARRARSVGFFDEGYQAAQLWKADWEQYDGDALCERAQLIIRQTDPMRQT
jgi:hypothetical protein